MHPIDLIRAAQSRPLSDEDGGPIDLVLLPGLDEDAIRRFEATLPCPLPDQVRQLLRFCRGFDGPLVEPVDFTGQDLDYEQTDIFPHGLPIAGDGYGNFWVVDLTPQSQVFGPVWFACHDAPVILYQSADLSGFLVELFKMCEPPHKSLVDDVHEDRIRSVWRHNPGVMAYEDALASGDAVMSAFAADLDPSYLIIDLRDARPGDGFSWGRYGPDSVVRRHGSLPVFAYQQKVSFWRRLFGG